MPTPTVTPTRTPTPSATPTKTSTPTATSDTRLFVHPSGLVTFRYPNEWMVLDIGEPQAAFVSDWDYVKKGQGAPPSGTNSHAAAVIAMVVPTELKDSDLAVELSFERLAQAARSEVENSCGESSRLDDTTTIMVDGERGAWAHCQGIVDGRRMHVWSVYTRRNRTLVSVFGFAWDDVPWNALRPLFEKIIVSIRFTDRPEAERITATIQPTATDRSMLRVGISAVIQSQSGECPLRHYPQLDARASVRPPNGAPVSILDGPVLAEGHEWWLVGMRDVAGWCMSKELAPAAALPVTGTPTSMPTKLPPTAEAREECDQEIAYFNGAGSEMSLWLMKPDGSNQRRILSVTGGSGRIAWSPDGKRLAFSLGTKPGMGCSDVIAVVDADGKNLTTVTPPGCDSGPSWSPDGRQIIYGNGTIRMVNADGTNPRVLIQSGAMPDWSPDGKRIVYSARAETISAEVIVVSGESRTAAIRQVPRMGLYVANADGSNPVLLTPLAPGTDCLKGGCDDFDPDWSPDGQRVVYGSGADLHIINADGKDKRRLVTDGDDPQWSADGTQIVFDRLGNDMGVYIVNVDGTSLRRLADGAWPSWQPCGR
ncbi:MAG: hypothetical protein FJ011_24530 [Chloroflexi bacterium]|nr:hypothetical protein [Chloroflexota bacterium]